MGVRLNPALKPRGLSTIVKQKASEELWLRGEIKGFLLDATQREMAREFEKSKAVKHVILCSRRLGKSYMLVTLAIEAALKKPYQYVKYLTSSAKAAREIVQPLFNQILTTCPDSVRPVYSVHGLKWIFNNGSEILLHGCDDGGDSLRGQSADLVIIDEAGFVNKLDTLVADILNPMVIERLGRIILSSTPPKEADHPFIKFIAEAEKDRALTKRVLKDCPRFTEKQLRMFAEEAGGEDSETYRREYNCEIIRSIETAIIPEFTDAVEAAVVYSTYEQLNYRPDTYVALDVGFVDNTAALFGFYDFMRDVIVIQREYVSPGNNTEQIANAVKKIEKDLWGGLPPLKRVSDTDLRLIKDLKDLHQIRFVKTEKTEKQTQVNMLRVLIKQQKIWIHESCSNLRMQLKYSQWKMTPSGVKAFQRSAELGHADCIDALLYFVRNVNKHRNPIPDAPCDPHSYWFNPNNKHKSKKAKALSKAFG